MMNGQLREHPLAELIREISRAGISGALRLQHEPVKVVIYFAGGELYYAGSNLRGHRLSEVVKRSVALTEPQLAEFGEAQSDFDLEAELLRRGIASAETLERLRTAQVNDILRSALLWTDGTWNFDPRARLAGERRVTLKLENLLMEAARHLPEEFVVRRMSKTDVFALSQRDLNGVTLSPEEAFILSRVQEPIELSQLSALSGMAESDGLRAAYTLALGGLLDRNEWPLALGADVLRRTASSERTSKTKTQTAGTPAGSAGSRPRVEDEERELEIFFARSNQARDYFDILDVGHGATPEMIKEAYHSLARRFHPDRFHQSDQALRVRIESAFARIAQAYETLSDSSARAAYEARLKGKTASPNETSAATGKASTEEVSSVTSSNRERAASAFNRGIAALKQNEYNSAVAHFAEAAHLAPQEARYRAQYGQALAGQKQTRRLGESELKVAVSLEPNNVSYRIMLAELYQNLGLRRRAQAELERALIRDPKHKHARALLADLQRQS